MCVGYEVVRVYFIPVLHRILDIMLFVSHSGVIKYLRITGMRRSGGEVLPYVTLVGCRVGYLWIEPTRSHADEVSEADVSIVDCHLLGVDVIYPVVPA